jgi:glycine/D-amino acid oxidase-like deaminating enzyme
LAQYSAFSGWVDRPGDISPALTGELECDVAIVGGGYTGMAAALRLAERGADVALIESAFCGWGASSRNAGHLTPTIAGDPQLLATVYRRRARDLIRFADRAVHFTEGLIARLRIECEYEPNGNVSAAQSTGQLRRAERIARILSQSGGEVEFVEGKAAGLPHTFLGGILERAGGILNPGLFARGLREALRSSKARVFERTAVQAVEPHGTRIVLSVPGGRVSAERVVLATNAYTRDLPFAPRRIVAPLWVTLAETEPIDPDRLDATGWLSRAGVYTQHIILESYRPTARGTVVFGSRQAHPPRGPLGAREPDPRVVADIVRGFHERFPSLRDVGPQRAWGGWIAMTPSWLPVAGEATANVFYAVGYNGHGLAQAPYLGTLLADRLAGDEPHDDLRTVWRTRPRFAPAPLFSGPALRAGWAIDRLSDRLYRRRS